MLRVQRARPFGTGPRKLVLWPAPCSPLGGVRWIWAGPLGREKANAFSVGPLARRTGKSVDTDDFSSYRLLEAAYDHRSVDHEKTYVSEEGTHPNPAEGEWSVFKVESLILCN